ncbi:crossover junction endodeoxyribonuclease [Gluconacetobacter johannae DSM 13595]|uniref:Uncharacterized protein n=1 Tax=Gluconacetobacter johannae TaxID=112140 RepID=A0A7W4J982_9PROT|nr:hypothetical protein [Gluconacetobacter johannae]MBB2177025.1 hypothetical protein [Gluconacetobacter johannae]GBQ82301.1 crossover junction endodeoxyribonuclease [Gluconacetobacter johannae DSM 13595]
MSADSERRIIAAIDPGNEGAVAILNGRGELVEILDMPTSAITVSGKARQIVSAPLLAMLLRAHDPAEVWMEQVHAGPQMGGVSAMSFGRGVGIIEGAVAMLGKPLTTVRPNEWKRVMRCPADKDGARTRAMQIFPTCADLFRRKKDDGRAEAAMIGAFAVRVATG